MYIGVGSVRRSVDAAKIRSARRSIATIRMASGHRFCVGHEGNPIGLMVSGTDTLWARCRSATR